LPPARPSASALATAALAAALALSSQPAFAQAPSPPRPIVGGPIVAGVAPEIVFKDSPVAQAKKPLAFGPTPDGSVRACEGNINPNCVSTASTNDMYSPPWRAPIDVPAAARALERAIPQADPTAVLVMSVELPSGSAYRAWQAQGVYGADIFEVVIKPERVPRARVAGETGGGVDGASADDKANNAKGGEEDSALITYRSAATKAKYLYPFQIVLSDNDAQRKRAMAVRAAVNFPLVGCTGYYECFVE
jgi:hypothetical protein